MPDATAKHDACYARCIAQKEKMSVPDAPRYSQPPPRDDSSMTKAFLVPVVAGGFLVILVGALGLYRRRQEAAWASAVLGDDEGWESGIAAPANKAPSPRYASIEAAIDALRANDDAFSWILFEDFLHTLYVEAERLRGGGDLSRLAPYFAAAALDRLAARRADRVETVIVGALTVEDVHVDEAMRRIHASARFTANHTETSMGAEQAYYVEEVWHVSRDADRASRPPARTRVVDCPNCGAPLDKIVGAKCTHCGETPVAGDHDWRVDRIELVSREPRGPMLAGTAEEVGTDQPTVVAPDVQQRYAALADEDPAFTWEAFVARVEKVFHTFHTAWSAQALEGVRPFLSDNLFETQTYWVSAYEAQGLRNLTADATIVTIHLSRVTSDKFYDAITVRVFATCFDWTLNAKDERVGGSANELRRYSEYWTFIRGVARKGKPKIDDGCPNCGADVAEINMSGVCSTCKVKVTNGDFDWVLSRIEQDEVYAL
jgi:predicted lipid-binding transport protein (Tim44 family)